MWGAGSRKGLVGRMDDFKLWNITRSADDMDATAPPSIRSVTGKVGETKLTVSLSEGVWTGTNKAGALTLADFALVDGGGNNPRTLVAVAHVAGEATAELTMSKALIAADVASDTLAAASNSAIYDDHDKAMATTKVTLRLTPPPACPTLPVTFDLNEAAGANTAADSQGVMVGTVTGANAFVGDGSFHGDGVAAQIDFANNQTCFEAHTKLVLEARIHPIVVDTGGDSTIERVFVKDGNNYQMSVWRNTSAAWNPPFNPPAGVTSMAFWVRVVDAHGGSVWKPLLSDHATCPILAGHWYRVRVDWDSGRVGVMPGQFWIEDQGTDGSGAAAAWSGLANCTDDDQSQSPADRKFSPGDQILGGDGIHHVAATNNKTLFFNGLIDWIKVLEVL